MIKKQNTILAPFSSGVNVTSVTNVERNGSMDIYAKRENIDDSPILEVTPHTMN